MLSLVLALVLTQSQLGHSGSANVSSMQKELIFNLLLVPYFPGSILS